MIDERAGELFDHLPDDLLDDYLDPTALHPFFTEIAGRAAVSVVDACCVLVEDHVLCFHARDDSTEIVTYKHKRTVKRVVITDDASEQ